jgi:hypothetical protein
MILVRKVAAVMDSSVLLFNNLYVQKTIMLVSSTNISNTQTDLKRHATKDPFS